MSENKIPYKIYLGEEEIPKKWYNLRADMKNKPAPLLNPGTGQPLTAEEMSGIFCEELVQQELDDTTPYIDIPQEIRDFYKMYRPAPLVRAYCLEKALGTPAKIYYKFEGNNTSGSHKLNSAIAQAYYAKKQGLKGVTTETGAVSGAPRCPWRALTSDSTARSSWSRSAMSRSPSAARSCVPTAPRSLPPPP